MGGVLRKLCQQTVAVEEGIRGGGEKEDGAKPTAEGEEETCEDVSSGSEENDGGEKRMAGSRGVGGGTGIGGEKQVMEGGGGRLRSGKKRTDNEADRKNDPIDEGGGEFKLELIFDNFIFALQRGFALSEALSLVPLTCTLLECACAGVPRTQTLRMFRDQAAQLMAQNRIKKMNLEVFSPQFLDDLLRHYRLFHFVSTQPRPPFEAHMSVSITAPKPPPPLSQSKPLAVWTYENKWNEIQNREDREASRREIEKSKFAEETAQKMTKVETQVLETVLEAPSFKDKSTLEHIVKDIADIHIEHLVGNMKLQVNDAVEKLTFKLEKTLLPRPQILGPPPRYSPSPLPPAPRPTKEPKGAAPEAGKAPGASKASAKAAPPKKKK